jgi:hypothetical protein
MNKRGSAPIFVLILLGLVVGGIWYFNKQKSEPVIGDNVVKQEDKIQTVTEELPPNSIKPAEGGKNFEITASDIKTGEYQGKLSIVISPNNEKALKDSGKDFKGVALSALPYSSTKTLPGVGGLWSRSQIGSAYILAPQNFVLSEPAPIKICYTADMLGYSSEKPLNELKGKVALFKNSGPEFLESSVDVNTHCVSAVISNFPVNGVAIIALDK